MPPVTEDHEKQSEGYPKDRRFKLSRACDRCRRRRIKCDEGHPCQACMSSKSECLFQETGKRSHPHKSKRAANLEDRMHQLESLIKAIPPSVFASISAGGSSDAAIATAAQIYNSQNPLPLNAVLPTTAAPLANPAGHFADLQRIERRPSNAPGAISSDSSIDQLIEAAGRMSIAPSFHYRDNQGETRWQGETSGLPLLDILIERHADPTTWPKTRDSKADLPPAGAPTEEYMPSTKKSKQLDLQSVTLWKQITDIIDPGLMDDLVKCFLSTSYYLLPFLHLPTFMEDYGSPEKWKEPGFGAFIVAVCCLSSRHIDDPRVRSEGDDDSNIGTEWFELFGRLRVQPGADRPTLYTIQAVFIGAVYAVGQGMLSRALSLLSEAATLSIDAGLHRSVDAYDEFDPVEAETRKRTFWCVYLWDKQSSAHFGRPPMVRLRDCDVGEPAILDDEYISRNGVGTQPEGVESRMSAFVCTIRLFVVLEAVLDTPPVRPAAAFLSRATSVMCGHKRNRQLHEEEALLDEVVRTIPPHWAHTPETMSSKDVVRVTQAERLHCFEQYVRLLIHRHRFSELIFERLAEGVDEQSDAEVDAIIAAHGCALRMVAAHLNIATRGLMTYYGVHVIHQLTAAGRTLVSIFLNYQAEPLKALVPSTLEAMRSCCGLLRRFSTRYACGLRASGMMAEFCRLTQIPLDAPVPLNESRESLGRLPRGIWMRPLRKKRESSLVRSASSGQSPSQHGTSPDPDMSPQSSHTSVLSGMNPQYGYAPQPGSSQAQPLVLSGSQAQPMQLGQAQQIHLSPDPGSMLGQPLPVDGYGFASNGIPTHPHLNGGMSQQHSHAAVMSQRAHPNGSISHHAGPASVVGPVESEPDIAAFLAFLNGTADPALGASMGMAQGMGGYAMADDRAMAGMYGAGM